MITLCPGLELVPKGVACARPSSAYRSTRVSGDLAPLWRRMMTVAYNYRHATYDPSCVVCEEWHDFSVFCEAVVLLPGSGDVLSRNYYGANCYSPLTSCWLTRSENQMYDRASGSYPCIDGMVFLCNSDVIEHLGVSLAHLKPGVVSHGNSKLRGHTVSSYTPPDGMLLRRSLHQNGA